MIVESAVSSFVPEPIYTDIFGHISEIINGIKGTFLSNFSDDDIP